VPIVADALSLPELSVVVPLALALALALAEVVIEVSLLEPESDSPSLAELTVSSPLQPAASARTHVSAIEFPKLDLIPIPLLIPMMGVFTPSSRTNRRVGTPDP
jgi:hypothetical protein